MQEVDIVTPYQKSKSLQDFVDMVLHIYSKCLDIQLFSLSHNYVKTSNFM